MRAGIPGVWLSKVNPRLYLVIIIWEVRKSWNPHFCQDNGLHCWQSGVWHPQKQVSVNMVFEVHFHRWHGMEDICAGRVWQQGSSWTNFSPAYSQCPLDLWCYSCHLTNDTSGTPLPRAHPAQPFSLAPLLLFTLQGITHAMMPWCQYPRRGPLQQYIGTLS